MNPQPTVPLAPFIAACKGAGLDVDDATRLSARVESWTGCAELVEFYTRVAYAACIVAAMGAGWWFIKVVADDVRGVPAGFHACNDDLLESTFEPIYGPTAADALFAALGGKL